MEKSSTKNILFLARWYPNITDPMPGLFIKNHAEAASRKNIVRLIYAQPLEGLKKRRTVQNEINKRFISLEIYYTPVKCRLPLIDDFLKGWRYLKNIFWGIRYVKKNGFHADLLHINILTRLGFAGLWMKYRFGIPYIITEHWSRYLPVTNTYHGFLRKTATKIIVKQARLTSVVTQNLKNAMLSHGLKGAYKIIHNVVDTELFKPMAKDRQPFTFVHVSCFEDRSKNISGMLEAVQQLAQKRQDFRVWMIGDGEDLEAMKTYCAGLKLEHLIRFFGLLEGIELSRQMALADCMLMFSNYENIPVVINEGFACGLPVVATAVGGIPEHVDDSRGILVECGDKPMLVKAMEQMMQNSDCYDAGAIRQYALDNFSEEKVAETLDAFYKSALKNHD